MKLTKLDGLFKKLAKIPHDKLLHSFYGTLVYAVLSLVVAPIVAAVVVVVIAASKEAYDEYKYKGADFIDFIFTIALPILLLIGA